MKNLIFLISLLLATFNLSLTEAKEKTPICSSRALSFLKKFPRVSFQCKEGEEIPETSAVRLKALKNFEEQINGLPSSWWSLPLSELNACHVRSKPGPLSKEEEETYGYGGKFTGDDRIRIFIATEPCSEYQNAFVAVKTGEGKTVVTRIADQMHRYADGFPYTLGGTGAVDEKTLAVLESCDSGPGYRANCVYETDQVDFNTGKFSPYPLFRRGEGGLSHFYVEQCDRESADDQTGVAIFKNGQWSKSFSFEECDSSKGADAKGTKKLFTWTGKDFVIGDYEKEKAEYEKKLKDQRTCLQQKFDPQKEADPDCPSEFRCETENDLAWLYYKAGQLKWAKAHSDSALEECRWKNVKEQKASQYNSQVISKGLNKR